MRLPLWVSSIKFGTPKRSSSTSATPSSLMTISLPDLALRIIGPPGLSMTKLRRRKSTRGQRFGLKSKTRGNM
ncbi:hypothetical protein JG688_00009062 [Phytophthora aleatoria]|uniref:Uncharacterized protein n=1 Tax=Phytophthora aleatoria TaxID=2496075 RepID=A0A8J5IRW2_9STRA|nr:hypothetical protein JG688_00009062 [Phytophthora aleatoria]